MNEVRRFLVENGVNNAVIRIWSEVDMGEVAASLVVGAVYRPTIVVANKIDVEGAGSKFEALRKRFGERFQVIDVSAKTKIGLGAIPKTIFRALNIARIYTKKHREDPSKKPIIMRDGATVEDVAKAVHSAFYKNFKYAKVWGSSKYPGEKVGLKYILKDKDAVELYV